MTGKSDQLQTPVVRALVGLHASVDGLIAAVDDGGLDHLDPDQLIQVMQGFEAVRSRLPVVSHHLIAYADQTDLPGHLNHPNLVRTLMQVLQMSGAEAGRQVAAAAALGPRRSALGQPLEPVRPVLAASQREGDVTTEQVTVILNALAKVDRPGFDPADIAVGERLLTEHARTFGPRDLKILADRFVDHLDPDGSKPDDELNADRRHFRLRPTRDGAYVGEMRLTGALGAKLTALLSPLAKPRVTSVEGEKVPADVDPRTHGQRMHDGLEDLADRMLRAGGLPDSGGTPTTVIVTITSGDLAQRTGTGTTSDGAVLSTSQILGLADQAEIVPVWLSRRGAVLDVGRVRRIANTTQTLALIARDGGCSFPGCDHPPEFCERHHLLAWADGGVTAVSNLALLCRYHHQHFVARGWSCRLNADGLPEWIPPKWVDRQRQPLVNTRIQARAHAGDLIDAARETPQTPPHPPGPPDGDFGPPSDVRAA